VKARNRIIPNIKKETISAQNSGRERKVKPGSFQNLETNSRFPSNENKFDLTK
jgi:hypothetical protein